MARDNHAIAMTEGPLLGVLVRVAIPIALSNLVQSSYDLINGLWLGQLGESAIAAVTASGPIFGVLIDRLCRDSRVSVSLIAARSASAAVGITAIPLVAKRCDCSTSSFGVSRVPNCTPP